MIKLKCVITLGKLRKSYGTNEQKIEVSKSIQSLLQTIVPDENWNFTDISLAQQLSFELANAHIESMYSVLQ